MTIEKVIQAMEAVQALHDSHGIQVKGGKKYSQVSHRVETFRKTFGYEYGMETEIKEFAGGFLCKCRISSKEGQVIASGLAFGKGIGNEKALEKIETTAVGRALANAGLGGGEYASLNEMETFEERYEPPKAESNGKGTMGRLADDPTIKADMALLGYDADKVYKDANAELDHAQDSEDLAKWSSKWSDQLKGLPKDKRDSLREDYKRIKTYLETK